MPENKPASIAELIEIMRRLRAPDGCPWDRKQTHKSLKRHLIEECAELLDAIDDNDSSGIREELGDILMHIVFHSRIAEDEGRFTFDEVAHGVNEKMRRRHPHIFAGVADIETPEQVSDLWQRIKAIEKGGAAPVSALSGVPRNLPALTRATMIQEKAAATGFDWPDMNGVVEKVAEEVDELKASIKNGDKAGVAEEVGDLFFALVNFCRFAGGKTAEELLQQASDKFESRFRWMERRLEASGKKPHDCTLDELEALWQAAKKEKPDPT